jgi:biopolymer transport protein ExbD
LRQALEQLHATTGDDRIVLRADQDATHGRVVEMIDTIKESGFTRVSLSARQATGP